MVGPPSIPFQREPALPRAPTEEEEAPPFSVSLPTIPVDKQRKAKESRLWRSSFPFSSPLKRFFSNDVTKLVFFLVATFTLAALLVPQVYNLGQFLAEVTENKSVNPVIDYVGTHARKADYARFFNRFALLGSAHSSSLCSLLTGSSQGPSPPREDPGPSLCPPARLLPTGDSRWSNLPTPSRQLCRRLFNRVGLSSGCWRIGMLLDFFKWNQLPLPKSSQALSPPQQWSHC